MRGIFYIAENCVFNTVSPLLTITSTKLEFKVGQKKICSRRCTALVKSKLAEEFNKCTKVNSMVH